MVKPILGAIPDSILVKRAMNFNYRTINNKKLFIFKKLSHVAAIS
jgi:hypothetical protein